MPANAELSFSLLLESNVKLPCIRQRLNHLHKSNKWNCYLIIISHYYEMYNHGLYNHFRWLLKDATSCRPLGARVAGNGEFWCVSTNHRPIICNILLCRFCDAIHLNLLSNICAFPPLHFRGVWSQDLPNYNELRRNKQRKNIRYRESFIKDEPSSWYRTEPMTS